MKKSLSLIVLFGSLTLASAQLITTNLYVEDWGTVKDPGSPSLSAVGWSYVLPAGAAGGGPYQGIFNGPPNELYFEDMAAGAFGILYTTDTSGAGSEGDSSFADINPAIFTNALTFNITRAGGSESNYFAIQEGGSWYVSTSLLPVSSGSVLSTPYTNLASAWNTLTLNAAGSGVTIGAPPSANLSGPITGIGLVANAPGSGWNYGQLTVSALVPATPPTAVLYSEDWGAASGGTAGTLAAVGWSSIDIAYTGMYGANAGSLDVGTGLVLSNRAMYLSMDGNNSLAGIAYTTDTNGSGTAGDSAFTDINPTNYPTGVYLSVETQASSSGVVVTNYFAIQVAGAWYVSVNRNTNNNALGGAAWSLNRLLYTNNSAPANWNTLTLSGASVTVGGPPSAPLSGPITGVGLVTIQNGSLSGTTGFGFNYLNFTITTPLLNPSGAVAPKIDAPGFSQTAFAGGTASFAIDAYVGTPPVAYTWTFAPAAGGSAVTMANGATGTGSFVIGALTNQITISNLGSADAGTYSVEVGNLYGADYSSNYTTNTLTVYPLTNNILYAETFPFVGPFAPAVSLTNVGWKSTIATPTLDNLGNAYAYETAAATVAFYAASNTDVAGLSGIPFPATGINPANYPFISFRATLAALQNSGNVATYFAVQMAGGKWYVSTSAIQLSATPAAFTTYGLQFNPTASGWNNLTLGATSATVGSTATANLTGNITGGGVVFVFTGAALYAMNNFMIVTNSTPPILPSFPSEPNEPYLQTVAVGGGASFAFTEAGTLPLTNNWELNENGHFLTNGATATGSVISGATTTEITIQNVSSADGGTYTAVVSNPAGSSSTDSSVYGSPYLTVTNQPVGYIYSEFFPLYQPTGGVNQPLSLVGWTYQAGQGANRLYSQGPVTGPTGVVSAYDSASHQANIYDLYYASTASDTGFSGLPFIAFDPANYPAGSIQFSTILANGNTAYTNVAASIAVQQNGQWYASVTPLWPFYTNAPPSTPLPAAFTTSFSQTYSNAASQWNMLGILTNVSGLGTLTNASGQVTNVSGVVLLGNPAQNLNGPITAAGLMFNFIGATGGDINFDSFVIQATGAGNLIGGVNIGPVSTNGTVTLTWIGNPAVNLQSATSVTSVMTDVPNTLGQHSFTVTPAGVQQYYRLVKH
jgi:hypothetical protein